MHARQFIWMESSPLSRKRKYTMTITKWWAAAISDLFAFEFDGQMSGKIGVTRAKRL